MTHARTRTRAHVFQARTHARTHTRQEPRTLTHPLTRPSTHARTRSDKDYHDLATHTHTLRTFQVAVTLTLT